MMNSDPRREVVVSPLTPGPLCDQVLDLAATGRAGLVALLGDARQRHALFRRGMRADRFFVATVGGALAGYMSLKYRGAGPFGPSLGDFLRCYGWARGSHAFLVFSAIEARSRPRPGGAYLYGIDVLKPFRGTKSFSGPGVGGALILAGIEAMTRHEITALDMEVRTPAARALATRMGARPVTVRRFSLERLLIATAADYTRLSIAIPPAPR
ncbi:hypothetical protein [Sediminicoccus sp. KRV36]|uniref:hypothetical protein n=1 Tax=Sediminicoccus sp. KRV36 TaxID=3133721 RepID=UPI00200E1129|nr:hypothetical protein [Sediminicoccus rosea]UPY37125.1 hypothetical protein LHU95_00060 [Sediminicoccus rosea]